VRLDSKSTIGGVPTTAVRDFLRRANDPQWNLEYVSRRLRLLTVQTERLVAELLSLGYVEAIKNSGEELWYRLTLAGGTFALASTARPLRRVTARRKLDEFLNRVRIVNNSDYFLYKVKRVLIFGSYLGDEERLNDVDIAVKLVHREPDSKRRMELNRERVGEVLRKGRQFSNLVDELSWPQREVLLFLKARSRAIALHTTDDPILRIAKTQVIFKAGIHSKLS
jgi:predicted nucleotidyltransferase